MPGASQAQAHRGNGSARIWAYHAVLHGNSADTPPRLLPRLARLRCIHLHDIGSINIDVPSQLGRPGISAFQFCPLSFEMEKLGLAYSTRYLVLASQNPRTSRTLNLFKGANVLLDKGIPLGGGAGRRLLDALCHLFLHAPLVQGSLVACCTFG